MNSLTVTIPATVIPILIAAFAAYALAWMRFPGRALLIAVIIGLLVVPLQMSLIPLLKLYNGVGVFFGVPVKTYLGIWLAHTGFGLPFAIYLLRSYIAGLPRELMESARIDGASDFEIFVKIVLPLSFPVLASFAIFQFLWVWNDLLVAMVFLGTEADQIVLTGQAQRAARLARRRLGNPHDLGLRHHHRAADRVLLAAALLRARPAGRLGQGRLTCRRRSAASTTSRAGAAAGPRLVARRGDLPDLSALASRIRNGDGIGDLDGHHPAGCRYVADLGVDAIWLSPVLHLADGRLRLRRLRLLRRRSDVRHARRFRRAGRRGAPARPQGDHRPGALAHLRPASLVQGEPRRAATTPRPTGTSGPTPSRTARRPTTGCRSSAARPGSGTRAAQQYYLHNFLAEQPDLNFHNPRGAGRAARRPCASGWSAASTASASTPSTSTSTTRAARTIRRCRRSERNASTAPAVNPYDFQEHLYDKTQPENLGFLEALPRAARRVSGDRARSARSATRSASLEIVAAYTAGGDKLHMCYTFDLLGAANSQRRACPHACSRRSSSGRRTAGSAGPSPTTTWCAMSRRWAQASADTRRAVASSSSALLLSLRGSVCLYQGEELGLTEAELAFEDLQRPLRHPLLAGIQGPRRLPHADGLGATASRMPASRRPSPGCRCRPSICRCAVDAQQGDPASVLAHYRRFLAFRRAHPACAKGDIEFLAADGDVARLHARARATSRSSAPSISAHEPAVVDLGRKAKLAAARRTRLSRRARRTARSRLPAYGAWFGRIA